MKQEHIKATVNAFLDLVRNGHPEGAESGLLRLLDNLAASTNTVRLASDVGERPEPEGSSYTAWRSLARESFPRLGCYNVTDTLSDSLGEGEIHVADALDDIADIAQELEKVSSLWTLSRDDALQHFIWSFKFHWGLHLRQLQVYLCAIELGF